MSPSPGDELFVTAFDKALAETLKREGEYSNRPGDPGGETVFGISRRRWPEWKGWPLVDAHKRNPEFPAPLYVDPDLERLVGEFYLTNFWHTLRCNELPEPVAAKLFDVAVNLGTGPATRLLQVALAMAGDQVPTDGRMGPQTLAAATRAHLTVLLDTIRAAQAGYYVRLVKDNPSLEQFINGWLNRARA